MFLSKFTISTISLAALVTATIGYAASEPMYLNYPLEQRDMSPAPEYLPDVGVSRSAGQMYNGYFEPTYLNYSLEQRAMSPAPEYLSDIGVSSSAGQMYNGYFEPTYLNYPK